MPSSINKQITCKFCNKQQDVTLNEQDIANTIDKSSIFKEPYNVFKTLTCGARVFCSAKAYPSIKIFGYGYDANIKSIFMVTRGFCSIANNLSNNLYISSLNDNKPKINDVKA